MTNLLWTTPDNISTRAAEKGTSLVQPSSNKGANEIADIAHTINSVNSELMNRSRRLYQRDASSDITWGNSFASYESMMWVVKKIGNIWFVKALTLHMN